MPLRDRVLVGFFATGLALVLAAGGRAPSVAEQLPTLEVWHDPT